MSNATEELKLSLSALCIIIENAIGDIEPGSISPELFRLAKQNNPNAVEPILTLCLKVITKSVGLSKPLTNRPEVDLHHQLKALSISSPTSFSSSKSLLVIFGVLLHRFNFVDEIFYESIDTSKLLQTVAVGGQTSKQTTNHIGMNTAENVFLLGKLRLYISILKLWKPPKLPEMVDYMSYEEFIIAQSPEKILLLDKIITSRIRIIKNFETWNSKEEYFWGWIQQAFDPELFNNVNHTSNDQLDQEARAQLKRIEVMNNVFSKLPKPKFRPDRMKAQSQLTQALLGNINITGGPPAGSIKMQQQTADIAKENLNNLANLITQETNAFPTFP